MTSCAKADGRFGKQDFVYLSTEDVYRCPAGEKLTYRFTGEEDGKMLRHYWTTAWVLNTERRGRVSTPSRTAPKNPVKRGKYGQPSRNNHACAFQGFHTAKTQTGLSAQR